nr:hypothetical protein [Armatimonadota bacterium]
LPAPFPQNEDPDVYQRALTLMAGETPGSGGEVRVWAPQVWRMCLTLISVCSLATAGGAALVLLMVGHLSVRLFLDFSFLISIFFMLPILYHCSQSGSVSADENGIAFRDLFGPSKVRYVGWQDVHSLYVKRYYLHGFNVLILDGSAESRLNLIGYSKAARAEMESFIIARAGLRPSPLDPSTLVCAAAPLPWRTGLPRLNNQHLSLPVGPPQSESRDDATEKSLLPVPGTAAGELQVWSRHRVRQLRPVPLVMAYLALVFQHPVSGALYFPYSYLIVSCLWRSMNIVRRPGYLTANYDALGVVTDNGFRVVPWSSIQSFRNVTAMGVIHSLQLKAPDTINIPMSAFPATERNRILEEIATRANLKLDAGKTGWYVR